MNRLVILESPRKVKHVQDYLRELKDGHNYIVMATIGHIVKIADVGISKVGIEDLNTMEPTFAPLEDKKDVISEITKRVKLSDEVIIATDPDREGEAIAYHCIQQFKIPKKKVYRAEFHEITKAGIKKGMSELRQVNDKLVDAAISRAVLDKCVGYRLSPMLWFSVGGKSAGRCQSSALSILSELEKKIQSFIPDEFFEIDLKINKNTIYQCKFIGEEKKKYHNVSTEKEAEKIIEELKKGTFSVADISHKEKSVSPKPAFTTSTVQQAASTSFGMSPKATSSALSDLFTDSLITYIRTDSTRLSPDFIEAAKQYIIEQYGKKYYKGYYHTEDKNAQAAHEAIRCTDIEKSIDDRLYSLIKARAIASLMIPSKIKTTTVTIKNGKYLFALTGSEILDEGYLKAYNFKDETDEDDGKQLPEFKIGELIKVHSLKHVKKETLPPKRYSEAGMIKELEKQGIGRPSTFTSIVETLKDRKYIKIENKSIHVTNQGIKTSNYLIENFPKLINVGFTAQMELLLDDIALGKANKVESLKEFWETVKAALAEARKKQLEKPKEVKEKVFVGVCPDCGEGLVERDGKFGKFTACSGYPKCKYVQKDNVEKPPVVTDGLTCPKCKKGTLVQKEGKGKKFYACNMFPKCDQAFNMAQYDQFKLDGTIPEAVKRKPKKK